jgi:hypothetical protein
MVGICSYRSSGRAGRFRHGRLDGATQDEGAGRRGVCGREDLPGPGVDAVDVAVQAYRVGAGGGPDVIQPFGVGVRVERGGGQEFRIVDAGGGPGLLDPFDELAVPGAGEGALGGADVAGRDVCAGIGVRPRTRSLVRSGCGSQQRAGSGHGRLPAMGVLLIIAVTDGEVVPGMPV